jgi:hypothetical protein
MQQDVIGHTLTPWKSADTTTTTTAAAAVAAVAKKRSFRRLSFFKPSNNSSVIEEKQLVTPVLTTNTMNKEYDPETGNKIINNFMIIKEIGRGMHGKVKLAEDLDTGELVVGYQHSYDTLLYTNSTYIGHQDSRQTIKT